MFMDICNRETPALAVPVLLKCDFSWFQPIIGRFYKMRFLKFNIYNLFGLLLTRCYRLTRCELLSVAR